MHNRLAAERTILVLFKLSGNILAVLVCSIILSLALSTLQGNDFYGCLLFTCHNMLLNLTLIGLSSRAESDR